MPELPGSLVEECMERLLDLYRDVTLSYRAEMLAFPSTTWYRGREVELYVKSMRELSIDEAPIVSAIIRALRDYRLRIYEYERILSARSRTEALARLMNYLLPGQRPVLALMPSALPAGIFAMLGDSAREMLEDSSVLRIHVQNTNPLYLPLRSGPIEIVAKRNSKSSYNRVVWLSEQARLRGVRVSRIVYLNDNREIFEYVFENGARSALERVPVNKLAHYIIALAGCGMLGSEITILNRVEENSHVLYAINPDRAVVSEIYEALRGDGPVRLEKILRGVIFSEFYRGAARVIESILSRITG